jgi:GT2 family glycosyltransferase
MEALREVDASIVVLRGSGTAYWAKGMASAERHVFSNEQCEDDYLLWLNDDVELDLGALKALRRAAESCSGSVVVGAARDPISGTMSYGGFVREGWHPLRFARVTPTCVSTPIDTFNGNIVLVPIAVARIMGGIDGGFSHAFADIDYGMRCKERGISVLLAPGTLGTCTRNAVKTNTGIRAAWKEYTSIKGGGHAESVRRYTIRHAPAKWPLALLISYSLWWLRAGRLRMTRRRVG